MAEERSLKVLANNTTFFNKVSSTLTKLLIPTKIGINGMMINIKRSATVKVFEQLKAAENLNDVEKKEQLQNRYEESYSLYLESIDKHIMDSIYKKVKICQNKKTKNFSLIQHYDIYLLHHQLHLTNHKVY